MKRCKECYYFNDTGTLGKATKGICEVSRESVHGMKVACTTDFKSIDDYGDIKNPVIFKAMGVGGVELVLKHRYLVDDICLEADDGDDFVIMCFANEDGKDALRLMAQNILDFLDGKEIEYPSLEIKNSDF